MLAEARAREVVAQVLEAAKKAGADAAELNLGGGGHALTRFANNEIHQNVESQDANVSLRLVYGKRTARTSTTRTDPDGLARLVERTAEVAKLAPEEETPLPVMSSTETDKPRATVDEATKDCTPEKRAELVKRVLDAVAKAGYSAAGYLSTSAGGPPLPWDDGLGTMVVANSTGLLRKFSRSSAGFSLTVSAKDSSGWVEATAPRLAGLDIDALAARAIEKARASANPSDEIEPGAYEVILEPAAVASLTETLNWGGFTGRNYEEGSVWSSGLLGKKVLGENITVRDDWSDERNPGPAFDEEGVPRSKLLLIDKGVLSSLTWDRRSAKKAGTVTTGHGYRVPNLQGSGAWNMIVDGGTTSLEDLVKSTKRGILVTRFWYNRLVDPKKLIITGMTRDGTFLVENGKIVRGIKNMRFNQSVIDMLNNVIAMSPIDPSFMVPAMRISGFNFTSKTKF